MDSTETADLMDDINVDQASGARVCELCGSNDTRLIYPGNIDGKVTDRFSQYAWYDDIYKCGACGFVFQDKKYAGADIGALIKAEKYLDEDIGVLNLEEKHHQFDQLIAIMQRFCDISDKNLMDAGANTGVFLHRVRPAVASVSGIEPSGEAAANARDEFGLDVQTALISEADVAPQSQDIVTMWDVIEHLYTPRDDLAALLQALRPGGMIFISTHDIESRFAKWCGRNYLMLMYQHFFHFSPRTLGRMMEDVGYDIVDVVYFRKSWSLAYIANLPEKKWPGSLFSRTVRALLSPLTNWEPTAKARITMPLREFFVIIGKKPATTP